jgi:hypothetical protein
VPFSLATLQPEATMTSFRIPATTTGTSAQKAQEAKIQLRSAIYYCSIRDITMATILGGFTPAQGRDDGHSPHSAIENPCREDEQGDQRKPGTALKQRVCMIYARPGSEIRNSMIVQVGRSGPALSSLAVLGWFPRLPSRPVAMPTSGLLMEPWV